LNSGFDFSAGFNINYVILHLEMRYTIGIHDHGWIGSINSPSDKKRSNAFFIIFGILL
jgi:hypothetical protein